MEHACRKRKMEEQEMKRMFYPNPNRVEMTPEEFYKQMLMIAELDDVEKRHDEMDALMASTLESLGYEKGIEIFRNTYKWYA